MKNARYIVRPVEIHEHRFGNEPLCRLTVTIHQLAEALGRAIDLKDRYTQNHSEDVAVIAHLIAKAMSLESNTCDMIHIAGHLHDIGKIGVSDQTLKNEGRLSDDQWLEMRKHPMLGYEILKDVNGLSQNGGIADMVLFHHERCDGSGYPEGLTKDAIPLGARILAVADSFSAMIDDRRYRKGRPREEAITEIVRCSGNLYDPQVVTAFLNIETESKDWLASLRFRSGERHMAGVSGGGKWNCGREKQ